MFKLFVNAFVLRREQKTGNKNFGEQSLLNMIMVRCRNFLEEPNISRKTQPIMGYIFFCVYHTQDHAADKTYNDRN